MLSWATHTKPSSSMKQALVILSREIGRPTAAKAMPLCWSGKYLSYANLGKRKQSHRVL